MKKLLTAIALSLLAANLAVRAAATPAVIPQPQKMEVKDGALSLSSTTAIHADKADKSAAEFLAARLRAATGFAFKVDDNTSAKSGIVLLTAKTADVSLGADGYTLSVTKDQAVVTAATDAGLFYGCQTLLQLLPPEIFSSNKVSGVKWEVPCVAITDSARFGWRGFMLDVSRHFFSKQEVKRLLDVMALHKLNTFHWHLVDDAGWRIEIKKYPKLTSVGAWRDGVGFGLSKDSTTAYGPDGRYGGFYTQDDIREIVAYAAKLHITIIPEIEMPGHSCAALVAYPEFGTGPGPFKMQMGGGVNLGIYSPAKPEAFEFLQNVLLEVFELFPSKYIHIGGDEVPKEPWKNDAACQALMKREGLKNEHELQSWFIRRMEKFVNARGKTLMGWSEIREGGIAPTAVLMDWIGGGREAANEGHDVVMTPNSHCYLDYGQSRSGEPRFMGAVLPLEKVYSFEPIPGGLAPDKQQHILGVQGNIWTEYISNIRHVEYMAFPRELALAEVAWSPKAARNYDDFLRRLQVGEKRLDALGVNYRKSALGDGSPAGIRVGGWQPSQITTQLATMDWDVTKNVTDAGKVTVNFEYTEGAHGIDIAWAALLEDGKEISRDTHEGFTGGQPRKPAYTLDAPALKPGAKYTLRAQIAGSAGSDSHGNVFWHLKPAAK